MIGFIISLILFFMKHLNDLFYVHLSIFLYCLMLVIFSFDEITNPDFDVAL